MQYNAMDEFVNDLALSVPAMREPCHLDVERNEDGETLRRQPPSVTGAESPLPSTADIVQFFVRSLASLGMTFSLGVLRVITSTNYSRKGFAGFGIMLVS
jgi:hypothetical protein